MKPYYQDDLVTLYHGDCLEIDAWLDADVLITDPPYGIRWKGNGISATSHNNRAAGIYNADQRPITAGIGNDGDLGVRDAVLSLWGDCPAIVFGSLLQPIPTGTRQVGVFKKALDSGNLTSFAGVRRDVEAIYFLGGFPLGGGGRSAVFQTEQRVAGSPHGYVKRNGGHPHTKPLDVMGQLCVLTNGTIADPFAGSGSTLVAARMLGRRAIGVELDERWCEAAAKRLVQGVFDFGNIV